MNSYPPYIFLSNEHPEGEEFSNWLQDEGFNAFVGHTSENFIDGINVKEDVSKEKFLNRLWEIYSKHEKETRLYTWTDVVTMMYRDAQGVK